MTTPRTLYPDQLRREHRPAQAPHQRPRTRADCIRGPRPCPYVGCKHHLMLDIGASGESLRLVADEPDQMAETCALDVAERGGATLEDIGEMIGVSKEAVRQLEEKALRRLRLNAAAMRLAREVLR